MPVNFRVNLEVTEMLKLEVKCEHLSMENMLEILKIGYCKNKEIGPEMKVEE